MQDELELHTGIAVTTDNYMFMSQHIMTMGKSALKKALQGLIVFLVMFTVLYVILGRVTGTDTTSEQG